jgi:hypothetical protein
MQPLATLVVATFVLALTSTSARSNRTVTGSSRTAQIRLKPTEELYTEVKLALDKVPRKWSLSPEMVKEYFDRELEFYVPTYRALLELSGGKDTCSTSMIRISRFILFYVEEIHRDLLSSGLGKYVLHYGKQKFRLCAQRVNHVYRSYSGMDALYPFDHLFSTALKIPIASRKPRLSELLPKLDLRKHDLSLNEMAGVVEQYVGKQPTGERALMVFLDRECAILMKTHGDVHELIETAAAFGIRMAYEDDLLRLKEYNRICLEFESSQKLVQILNNLSRERTQTEDQQLARVESGPKKDHPDTFPDAHDAEKAELLEVLTRISAAWRRAVARLPKGRFWPVL